MADPAAVAAWSTVEPFEPGGVIVLAAADTVRALAADRYVGGEVVRQLTGADLIVVTKLDRCEPSAIDAVGPWLERTAPSIPRVPASHGDVPADVLLGVTPSHRVGCRRRRTPVAAEPDPMQQLHTEGYETWAWSTDRPLDRAWLTSSSARCRPGCSGSRAGWR